MQQTSPSGFSPPVNIARPSFPCGVRVEKRDLVAVAECVGDQWWRGYGEVLVQGSVSCAAQVEAEASKSKHDRVRVEV